MRGLIIRQIFRLVHENHCPATKKNKEWQEKLPAVVLKAEEIMITTTSCRESANMVAELLGNRGKRVSRCAPKARTTFGWGRTTRKPGPSSGSRPLVGWGSAEMELIPKVPEFMAGKSAIRNSLGRIMVSHRGDGWGRSDCSKELI
ncbi:Uncharacterized protein Adt_49024 [Abeliophyllum distichum]|uniref:Uncharacterized protein n=1 Tax=Abeliophyllum distichum TaxID=126358 RepID=A0ABD1NR94_9LAMI